MRVGLSALLIIIALASQGCGQTGPLYLPETDAKVVITPPPGE